MQGSTARLVSVVSHSSFLRGSRTVSRWLPPNAPARTGSISTRMIEPKTIHHLSRRLVRLSIVLFLSNVVAAGAQVSSTNAQTIEDPSGRAMLGFHDSLARSYQGEWVTRILHFGDSHIAADILTGSLRRQLQACFGDAGPGFVLPGRPWVGYSRAGVTSRMSAGWLTDGLTQSSVASDGRLGLAGVSFSTSAADEWITMTAAASYFDVYVLKQPGGGSIRVMLDGIDQERYVSLSSKTNETGCIEVAADGPGVHTIEIRTTSPGRTRIFGVAIERNSAGVIYDSLGINGARASRLFSWDWKVFAANLARRDADLIVLAYGSNEVSDADLDLEEYRASFTSLLNRFHKAAPRASILVIAPPDRAVRTGNRWRTIGRMRALVEVQRRAAFDAGAAFYDLYSAMGGSGSIERWATLAEPLAQPDRVHLTGTGYRLVADWLFCEMTRGFSLSNNGGQQ